MILSYLKRAWSPAGPRLALSACLLALLFAPMQGFSALSTKLKPDLKALKKDHPLMMGIRQALQTQDFDPMSPQGSWFLFNENDAHNRKKNRKRKCKRCPKTKTIPMPKQGPTGPQGPRGPQGPQGLSGGTLSLEEIENYVKVYLADILLKNKTVSLDLPVRRRRSPFKEDVPVIFTAQLPQKEVVPAAKAALIKGLTVTFGPGQFKRGVLVRHGKFTVTMSGVYHVTGTLPLLRKESSKKEKEKQEEKNASVYLCVDNCVEDRRLRWSGSMEAKFTTAVISGHVRLKRGQTIMLLLSNPTRSTLEVLPGSSFSASLIGT